MPLLRVDLAPLKAAILAAYPGPSEASRFLGGLASVARTRIITEAQRALKTSARDYVAGVTEVEIKGNVARIVLNGMVPNMVENGWPETDLRTTLLGPGAKNAKTAQDGSRYNTVPFRHGTPGTSGRNVGKQMPKSIHAVAKTLAPTLSRPGKIEGKGGSVVMYGQRLNPGMSMSGAARKLLTSKQKPWHATSIYMSMIREEKTYASATQSKYTTFRRISTNVRRAKQHWLHPGIRARNFFPKAQRDIERVVRETLGRTLAPKGSTR